jgi:hypothetical protein
MLYVGVLLMLTRIILLQSAWLSFAGKRVGREVVADLPRINFPTKPKPEEDERLPMSLAYETMSTTLKR